VLVHATTLKGSRVAPPQSDVTPLPLTTPLMKNSNPAGRPGEQVLLFLFAFLPLAPTQNINFPASCFVYPGWSILFFLVYVTWWCTVLICPPTIFATLECKVTPLCALQKGVCDSEAFPMFAHFGGLKEPVPACNFGFQSSQTTWKRGKCLPDVTSLNCFYSINYVLSCLEDKKITFKAKRCEVKFWQNSKPRGGTIYMQHGKCWLYNLVSCCCRVGQLASS
jgi:hypothetical protein